MIPKLSIIIVNWNTQALLKQCVDSIIDSNQLSVNSNQSAGYQLPVTDHSTEIIIVDNGSSDNSVGMVKKLITDYQLPVTIRLIENKENFGFGKANNQGIKIAQGDYVMMLNSDTIVKPGAIELLVEHLDTHPDTAIIGPKLLNPNGTSQANCGKFPNIFVSFIMLFIEKFALSGTVRYSPVKIQTVDWLMGAAFMARREVFDQVGLLDEGIFMYMEEVEWFYRVSQEDFKVEFYPKAEIIHLGRGSSKSGKKDPILNIYQGLLYFYKKHYGKIAQIILLIMLKSKALLSYLLGVLRNDRYLKETYGEAFKIH